MVDKIIKLAIVLTIGGIIFTLYLGIKYANTPIGEVPLWVVWFLFNK